MDASCSNGFRYVKRVFVYQTLLVNMWTVLPPCCWWMIFRLFFVADGSGIEGFLPDEFPLHIEVRGCPAGLVIDSRWFES